jgi:uncharacterized membrane protein/thiol-disulfide isomerase/thioredoxin
MILQYEPNVKATIAYLKLLKVEVNDSTVNETMHNHPDYPTLLCINDSLSKWKVANAAGKIDKQQLDQMPLPFVAHINNSESPLALVLGYDENTIRYQLNPYGRKIITENRFDFFSKWDGIYLLAEATEDSREKNFEANRRKEIAGKSLWALFFGVLALLPLLFFFQAFTATANFAAGSVAGIALQYLMVLAGLAITSLLLWYEIDKSNPALQKVCSSMKKGNCEAVLNSKHSKVFSWLSWSEVGFFYFAGAFLTLLAASANIVPTLTALLWLNILAAPYVVFSLIYQWKAVKQWCVLCLGIQMLLLGGLVNGLSLGLPLNTEFLTAGFALEFATLYLLPVIAWYCIKPLLLRLVESKTTKREYLKLKFNTEIFNTLLSRQKTVKVDPDGMGISLGNPNSRNKLVKVCNPYCGPCAKAHPSVEKLVEEFEDIHVKIIFACNNGEHDRTAIPAKHLLAIHSENNPEKLRAALDDWYLAREKNYDEFKLKYPDNGGAQREDDHLNRMKDWCQDMEIQFTPTYFINGRQLPTGYNVEDLRYFFSE